MIDPATTEKFSRLVHKIDPNSTLLRVWPLTGGISAQVNAVEIKDRFGQTRKLVVRQHGAVDFGLNPDIARDEFTLLTHLHVQGLPIPKPLFVDESDEILSQPYLVVAYVDHDSDFNSVQLPDHMAQLAQALATIHRTKGVDALSFLPNQAESIAGRIKNRPMQMDDSIEEGHIRAALEFFWPWPQWNPTTLLHGDYWPGNVLWKDGKIAAVIDWEDAMLGDPLADLGNTRLEILWAYGEDAMQQFTRAYQAILPSLDYSQLPYWDLSATIRPAALMLEIADSPEKHCLMRKQRRDFANQAIEDINNL